MELLFSIYLLISSGVFKTLLSEDIHQGTESLIGEQCEIDNSIECDPGASYRRYDGKCNNLKCNKWGSTGITHRRFLEPVDYGEDLTLCQNDSSEGKKRLPPVRKIVSTLNKIPTQKFSKVTVMNMNWGQFISHDINLSTPSSESDCDNCTLKPIHCERCLLIDFTDDPFYSHFNQTCLGITRVNRTEALPQYKNCAKEQMNNVTSYIDGSHVYGNYEEEANDLRDLKNGTGQMKVTGEEELEGDSCPETAVCPLQLLPISDDGKLLTGDGNRAILTPPLTSLHTLFVRLHNDLAKQLAAINGTLNDEEVYQEIRKIVIALIQHITYNEYLPTILPSQVLEELNLKPQPPGSYFTEYDNTTDATTRNAFTSSAYRFGHSLVPDNLKLANGSSTELSKLFLQNNITHAPGSYPSDFLNGIAVQPSHQFDQNLAESISNKLFANEEDEFEFGQDLYSTNIMRGRDHGLPRYNKWREYCNLTTIESFEDLKEVLKENVPEAFEELYESVEDIDLYPAAISEIPDRDGLVGATLTCLISEQFRRFKYGDRFFYENENQPKPFNKDQLNLIRNTTLSALLCRYTNTNESPQFVLEMLGEGNAMKNCSDILNSNGRLLIEFENAY